MSVGCCDFQFYIQMQVGFANEIDISSNPYCFYMQEWSMKEVSFQTYASLCVFFFLVFVVAHVMKPLKHTDNGSICYHCFVVLKFDI